MSPNGRSSVAVTLTVRSLPKKYDWPPSFRATIRERLAAQLALKSQRKLVVLSGVTEAVISRPWFWMLPALMSWLRKPEVGVMVIEVIWL